MTSPQRAIYLSYPRVVAARSEPVEPRSVRSSFNRLRTSVVFRRTATPASDAHRSAPCLNVDPTAPAHPPTPDAPTVRPPAAPARMQRQQSQVACVRPQPPLRRLIPLPT